MNAYVSLTGCGVRYNHGHHSRDEEEVESFSGELHVS